MTLLILGAGGQLGGELARLTAKQGDAVALTRDGCDITDAASLRRSFDAARPSRVINAAAYTAVDAAEEHLDLAIRVNADGARNVAALCAERGIALCHVSTDYVFDGTASAPISESALPNPQSAYGLSKWLGELAVRELHPAAHLVRTAWLFGGDGPNFVLTMLRLMEARDPVRVVDDQRGTPTWTGHLAPAVLTLLDQAPPGVYHLTNSGEATWFELACAIADAVHASRPEPISTAQFPRPAPRPAYSVLDNAAWRALGHPPLPDWRDGLRQYLKERGR